MKVLNYRIVELSYSRPRLHLPLLWYCLFFLNYNIQIFPMLMAQTYSFKDTISETLFHNCFHGQVIQSEKQCILMEQTLIMEFEK